MEVTPVEAFDDTDGAARAQLNDSDGAARARLKAELKAEILAELDAQELRGPELLDVARSIKPTIMGEMGGSSVMRKRLSTMARVETGEDKVPSFQPLHERTDASYYFRVETMVLYDPTTWRVAMHWVLVCLSVLLQLLALQTVWQALWYPFDFMKWGLSVDEARRYFHSGIAFPASYRKLFHYADDSSLMGVPIIVFGPLFFCVFVLVMSTTDEEASCKAGYLLLRREVAAADARTAKVRLVACYLLHVVRLSLVWYVSRRAGLAPSARAAGIFTTSPRKFWARPTGRSICCSTASRRPSCSRSTRSSSSSCRATTSTASSTRTTGRATRGGSGSRGTGSATPSRPWSGRRGACGASTTRRPGSSRSASAAASSRSRCSCSTTRPRGN